MSEPSNVVFHEPSEPKIRAHDPPEGLPDRYYHSLHWYIPCGGPPELYIKSCAFCGAQPPFPQGVLLRAVAEHLGCHSTAETGMAGWRPILRLGSSCLASWDCMGLLQSSWPHLRRPGRVADPEAPNYGQNMCLVHRRPDESRPGDSNSCQTDPTTYKCYHPHFSFAHILC